MPGTSSLFLMTHCLVHLPYMDVHSLFGSLSLFTMTIVICVFSNSFSESHHNLGAVQQGHQSLKCLH